MRLVFLLLPFSLALVPPMFAAPDQRILVIAAPALTDEAYRAQAAVLLPEWAGLLDRDFVVQTQFGAKLFPSLSLARTAVKNSAVPRYSRPKSFLRLSMLCPCVAPKYATKKAQPTANSQIWRCPPKILGHLSG